MVGRAQQHTAQPNDTAGNRASCWPCSARLRLRLFKRSSAKVWYGLGAVRLPFATGKDWSNSPRARTSRRL